MTTASHFRLDPTIPPPGSTAPRQALTTDEQEHCVRLLAVRAWWSCSLGEPVCLVEATQQAVQVGTGVAPVEGLGGLLVASLEAKQALLQLGRITDVVG